jgi:signal transduction histidine kinase
LETPEFTTQTRDIRRDLWTQAERLFVAAPLVKPGGALAGYVQLSIPMTRIHGQNAQTWAGLLLAGGSVALLTALISLGLAHFILHPIGALTRGAAAVADGDLTQRVRPTGPEELRRLASAFNVMTARLRNLLARQRDFVAHAAHELRTPLTALSLRLEMVQTHGETDRDLTARYIAQMAGEIDHLRRLSDQLLTLAALDAHELPARAPLDLAPMLYQLADDIGPMIKQSEHTLHVEVPPHLPPVLVNADQIKAAIRNLLDNAIKHTRPGDTIMLKAAVTPDEIRVTVSDSGPGIPKEAMPRIFDRFYRVDPGRTRKRGGTGLGLALVKEIAEAYGGHVEVESQPGRGSHFTLVYPIHRENPT